MSLGHLNLELIILCEDVVESVPRLAQLVQGLHGLCCAASCICVTKPGDLPFKVGVCRQQVVDAVAQNCCHCFISIISGILPQLSHLLSELPFKVGVCRQQVVDAV